MELETARLERAPRQQEVGLDMSGQETDPEGIPVAAAVDDGAEDSQVADIAQAEEYRPKSSDDVETRARKRPVKYALSCLVAVAIISAIVSGVVYLGIDSNTADSGSADKDDKKYREELGIRENIEKHFPQTDLDSKTSPYHKALEWITYVDPSEPHPDDDNFIQRYTLAYLYFATTERGPWTSCNPANEEAGESVQCVFYHVPVVHSTAYVTEQTNHYYHPYSSYRWLSETHECQWAGIFCDENQQEVVEIRLGGVGLSGTFPEGIHRLSSLQKLNLPLGDLTGPLFPGLGKMSHLTFVDIQYNGFTGEIPPEWWEASNLQELSVGSNILEGTIPSEVSSLVKMKKLFLQGNMFEGEIPSELGLLDLRKVGLFDNAFRGSLPTSLMTPAMEDLLLGKNLFTGAIPTEIGRMSKIRQLRLRYNLLSGPLIEDVFQLSSLYTLDARGCNLSGTLSHLVGNLDEMDTLFLNENNFSGNIPEELASCTSLLLLWLHMNNFTGTVPYAICLLRNDERAGFNDFRTDCLATTTARGDHGEEAISLDPLVVCPNHCCTTCCDQNDFCRK